ncbi:MAG: zinc dependent phospholipase C family protein [Myxococcota bacterium]|nr:zinc dependent phospholipase C family protein [Myxococcota bacterium]
MPKEICHFLVAKDVMAKLQEPMIRQSCLEHPNLVLLGSIFHDSLYYGSSTEADLSRLADQLHATEGQDSFAVLRELKSAGKIAEDESLFIAFWVGVASHICTDIRFHPLVYAFSGDYYSQDENTRLDAQRLHRQLESHLDFLFAGPTVTAREFQISRMLNADKNKLTQIMNSLVTHGELFTGLSPKSILDASKKYAWAQKLYQSQIAMLLSKRLRTIMPSGLRKMLCELGSLRTATSLDNKYRFLADSITFNHPVTNEGITAEVSSLREAAVADTIKLVSNLDRQSYGACLDTGLPRVSVHEMRYYKDTHIARIRPETEKRV